jgi:hypothetical protein
VAIRASPHTSRRSSALVALLVLHELGQAMAARACSLRTEDVIRELESSDQEFGIDIWQAETDVVQLKLNRLPVDMKAFAARVYKFCPDIVDQGVGSARALEREIAKRKAVFLWWD